MTATTRGPVPASAPAGSVAPGVQVALDELEPTLVETTFVVVDLETTGTNPRLHEITEIGAVRVRGGVVEAELSTFVAVHGPLPPSISALTGIHPADLVGAPSLGEAMATFLEFSRGAVLVAHNARFDLGFLRAAAAATGRTWPEPQTLCTLALSRRVLHPGETRGHRLGELAAHLGARTEPTHRALADARATVDVLHALIGRVGDCGVVTLSDLKSYDNRLSPEVRRRGRLTEGLPTAPGVYVFRDASGGALYVGSSVDVRRRARSYFSGGDSRGRMRVMVGLCESVEAVACAHMLEAWTVEEQLIDRLQPPYNRRSRTPRRGWWLSPPAAGSGPPGVHRNPEGHCLGPFRRSADARQVWSELATVAPSADGPVPDWWAPLVEGEDSTPLRALVDRVDLLAREGAFERAARLRDHLSSLIRVLARQQQSCATARCPEIVLAQRAPGTTWAVAVIRYGRLAASGTIARGAAPMPVIEAIRATAATVTRGAGPLCGATPAQVAAIHRWIDSAPTRIVDVHGGPSAPWSLGMDGAHRLLDWAERAERAGRTERSPATGR